MKFEDLRNVILCGLPVGGLVITGVADRIPERISSLVYLAAFVPKDGDSVFTLSSNAFKLIEIPAAAQLGGIACAPVPSAAFGMKEHMREWFERSVLPRPERPVARNDGRFYGEPGRAAETASRGSPVVCNQRLGRLLRYYTRAA
jgi:pimeloyl-ACP methyl ester carboxylesterase